jgi:hypothetical protein
MKLTLCLIKHYAMKTYGKVEVKLHHFDLGTRWRRVVRFTPRPLYARGRWALYSLDRRLSGSQSRSGRYGVDENISPCRESNPGSLA